MSLFRTKSVQEIVDGRDQRLPRVLGPKALVGLGIGAIVGAGIFSTLGTAAVGDTSRLGAGPGLVVSFLLLGCACALAGLCYSELTAMIPVSGSAYTYAFATMGELVAWIIGWDLILEYAVGNIGVAIAWSGYFQTLLEGWAELPFWLSRGYEDAMLALAGFQEAGAAALAKGDLAAAAAATADAAALQAGIDGAPHVAGFPVLLNLPAVGIVLAITMLLVRGIRESTRANNVMVVVKLFVLLVFLGVGAFYVNPDNWKPFAPNGWTGIHQGAAVAFFAYIGFDAVSTAAEEAKDPQRTMPIGILGSLAICTLLYMLVGVVATGLVPYTELGKGADPLTIALEAAELPAVSFVVAAGAVVSMAAVLLVFQIGQPRIFFSMARDGLLPKGFAKVHPKYQTPHGATILTGLVVAAGAAVMDDAKTWDLCSIGTLFAFVIVCAGVLVLRVKQPEIHRPFKVPFVWVTAPLAIVACVYVMLGLPEVAWIRFGVWLGVGLLLYFVRRAFVPPRTAVN